MAWEGLSAGIRLSDPKATSETADIKDGILLEVGFDDVTPNHPMDIISWAILK